MTSNRGPNGVFQAIRRLMLCLPGVALPMTLAFSGCMSADRQYSQKQAAAFADQAGMSAARGTGAKPEDIVLREGDTVRITFPGAANLNSVAQIRRDGKVSLPLIGEFQAAGLTPARMQEELLKLYSPQLQTKEVTVAVESAAFPIYVSGAVLRPGRLTMDRPVTALEAIMEAGGFDAAKANMKSVTVIRRENGATQHYKLNLKKVLVQGQDEQPFKLKPADIIFVPEKFSWF